ncbi:PREDICTED: uncharacterized protein LOC100633301 isoform X2 [Amphimedon queenslandica]|uniref:Uncharacterized protein n=1 Tax=Amphimedon queenslandica TaxID=400682 RepID=A0AAN0IM21_AMPQE|nr:PREDICTED: uncharacterized protein LOC100633301 isoform X2 [Amphimedon queenslandica]|eukprot:XP_011404071.1 PREDICTED: uncharacterized protein LOC100633301 isoform X2 [Amphimedon queenslandica]
MEGIPSSPVITGNVTSPGVLVLRVRTMYPGDTNIKFIVNTTNTSDESINSTTHQFNGYEANSIVDISISIPNGGSVSVSIVTINQYGSSDVLNHPQIFTIDPSSSTPSVSPTASMTATMSEAMSSTPLPTGTTTPATVDRSGLSAGAIAGIIIAVIILLAVVVLIGLIVFYVYYKNRGGSYQVDRPGKKGGVTVEELDIDIGTELQDKSTELPKPSESKPPELHYADLADFSRKPPAAAADKPEGSVTKPTPIEEVQYAQIKPQAKPKDDAPNPASDIL